MAQGTVEAHRCVKQVYQLIQARMRILTQSVSQKYILQNDLGQNLIQSYFQIY